MGSASRVASRGSRFTSLRAEIARQTFDQSHQGSLAHGVHGATHKGHPLGIATANGDDTPARLHVFDGGLRGDEHRAHVHGHGTIKILEAIVVKGCHHPNACVHHRTLFFY